MVVARVGADGQRHVDMLGNDIAPDAAMDRADRDHPALQRIDLAAYLHELANARSDAEAEPADLRRR